MSLQQIAHEQTEDTQHVEQTMLIQQPAESPVAVLIAVIEKDVAEKLPGHRCIQGHYVGPASGDIPLPSEKRFTIGRKSGSSDLYLDYPDVSRIHAAIQCIEGTCTVTDLESLNGTWLNEQRIVTQRPQLLQSGDILRFGQEAVFLFSTCSS
jgi:FHA domain